jgi:hypothetical protein
MIGVSFAENRRAPRGDVVRESEGFARPRSPGTAGPPGPIAGVADPPSAPGKRPGVPAFPDALVGHVPASRPPTPAVARFDGRADVGAASIAATAAAARIRMIDGLPLPRAFVGRGRA